MDYAQIEIEIKVKIVKALDIEIILFAEELQRLKKRID